MTISRFEQRVHLVIAALALAGLMFVGMSSLVSAKPSDTGRPDVIPGQYIVVFNDNVADIDAASQELALQHGASVEQTYHNALRGFAGAIPPGKLNDVKNDPRVAFVSEDATVNAFGRPGSIVTPPPQVVPTRIQRIDSNASSATGAGVGVAVIDTGIDLKHPDLAANIVANTSCITGKKTGADDNGHGTHVAGTIAALNNTIGVMGVAPQADLIAVKVLNAQGSGSWSSIICGLDWVTANAATYNIKVANLSLGGGGISDNNCGLTNADALHQAICRTRDAGVTLVVAAGNSSADTATSVPAAYDDAVITVSALVDSDGAADGLGASTNYGADDTFASFSNFGDEVDLGAPGANIYSTWKGGSYSTISGTSMAAPHVSGALANFFEYHPGSAWTEARAALISSGEVINAGHTDPSGLHPEAILNVISL